ncbi:translation initiation factor IF-2 associated domain-containing protein, partial [Gammaproteobacteria bacterium]|nr:translation initiation factor IF-2 associated domain-containing protein [Gammaproteobacteria bacterium]
MSDESIQQLAERVGTPIDRFLLQIEEAGLPQRNPSDSIKKGEIEKLLAHLKASHGEVSDKPKKITLKRRTLSTLKTGGSAGRGRTVNVEVRKKRTYVRRSPSQDHAQEKQALGSAPADPISENIEPLALVGEKEKAEAGQDKTNFESPKKEGLKKDESETQGKASEQSKAHEEVLATKQKDPMAKEKTDDDSRFSGRKNKRTKHDIDEDEKQKKKSRQGSRKRRVEELISEDLLDEDLRDEEIPESDEPVEAGTLGLAAPRAKRKPGSKAVKKHSFKAPTQEIKREVEIAE